jgi:hypothetical protein
VAATISDETGGLVIAAGVCVELASVLLPLVAFLFFQEEEELVGSECAWRDGLEFCSRVFSAGCAVLLLTVTGNLFSVFGILVIVCFSLLLLTLGCFFLVDKVHWSVKPGMDLVGVVIAVFIGCTVRLDVFIGLSLHLPF